MKQSNNSLLIAPSILAADFGCLASEIQSVEKSGADWLHIDVMDGSFVPPITFGANMVALAKRASSLPLDVHLMIERPETHFEEFVRAGANTITIHEEVSPHLHRSLSRIRELKVQAGVSINPSTPAEAVFPVLDVADLVLIMTVNPGWGGQEFIPSCLRKIESVAAYAAKQGLSALIQVDGGINPDTARRCADAGARVLVAGSYVFQSKDRREAIARLRQG